MCCVRMAAGSPPPHQGQDYRGLPPHQGQEYRGPPSYSQPPPSFSQTPSSYSQPPPSYSKWWSLSQALYYACVNAQCCLIPVHRCDVVQNDGLIDAVWACMCQACLHQMLTAHFSASLTAHFCIVDCSQTPTGGGSSLHQLPPSVASRAQVGLGWGPVEAWRIFLVF